MVFYLLGSLWEDETSILVLVVAAVVVLVVAAVVVLVVAAVVILVVADWNFLIFPLFWCFVLTTFQLHH